MHVKTYTRIKNLISSSVCVCKYSGTNSYIKSLYYMTPVFVSELVSCSKWSWYEMVFVRNDLTPRTKFSFTVIKRETEVTSVREDSWDHLTILYFKNHSKSKFLLTQVLIEPISVERVIFFFYI